MVKTIFEQPIRNYNYFPDMPFSKSFVLKTDKKHIVISRNVIFFLLKQS